MNDEQMRSLLEEEFRTLDTTPEDVESSTRRVMERKARVRQRSRWWPFPVFYRRHDTPTGADTNDDPPSPIPATNGHSPTVNGRTQSMLSPAKAITAGALVFAIGGAFLIAQPFERPASAPGASAPAEPPVEFSGRLLFGPQTVFGTEEQGDGRTEIRGHVFRTPVYRMSDGRLDGEWTRTNNLDQYDDPSVWTWQAMWRVETDDGAWEGLETPIVFSDGSRSTTTSVLVGEGDYAGLVAVMEFALEGEAWDVRGVIVDGEMPPAPEPAGVE